MITFEKWDELANKNGIVVINHALFDEQKYECEAIHIINDEKRIGIVIKGRDLFVYKSRVENLAVYENAYMVEDDMMTITIVKKM